MLEVAPYAARATASRGRVHREAAAKGHTESRSEYQRDRDRIIHSTAFRRLEYKTQVFVNHEGDLFRTRLTHSLEVAQIARSIARQLNLDEDLTEAITLAHDLGHTPFGHAGQDALNACMKPYGGFEHNLQSLRVVDQLEQRYGGFDGLNLTFETREGILKHCSRRNALQLGAVAERFIKRWRPSLEAQLVNLADELAYNNHDVDDGLRSGLITLEQLSTVPIFRRHRDIALKAFPKISGRRLVHETVRRMISTLATDLTRHSAANIAQTVFTRQSLSALPRGAHEQQGAAHPHRTVRRPARRTQAAAAGFPGAHARRQSTHHRGLHRWHDRSLRNVRAPPPVCHRACVAR